MLFLKQLTLTNFCNYDHHVFDFTREDGTPYPFVCFFGPNGAGKSTLLEAISMLTQNTAGRSANFVQNSLQKYVRHLDYNPTYQQVIDANKETTEMVVEGIYEMDGQDFVVRLTQNGWERNDFAPVPPLSADLIEAKTIRRSGPWKDDYLSHMQRISHFIRSDSDLSMNKFQLHESRQRDFEQIISKIMRFPAECIPPTGLSTEELNYCTDFVIVKNSHRIHFKRMSAGERKICKSFSELLNLMRSLEHPGPGERPMPGWPPILLLDNCVMHVYYDRHVQMVDSLKDIFAQQQIFATTHSGILIQRYFDGENDNTTELMIDLATIN
ncbi:hypothetical protein LCGC14_1170720 [marine sediment metagenome]|uniref:Rad50/SbcC-type AAA domain-containing protein n=1 Tax=marine sediment metagenome TaxID=412755 RepID=A0A0F9LUR3_9ZZZZ